MINPLQNEFREKIGSLEAEVNVWKVHIAGGAIEKIMTHTKSHKPQKYEGMCDPKLLEKFFWSLECYYNATRVEEDKSK